MAHQNLQNKTVFFCTSNNENLSIYSAYILWKVYDDHQTEVRGRLKFRVSLPSVCFCDVTLKKLKKKQFQKRRKIPEPTTSKFEKSSSLGLMVKVSVSPTASTVRTQVNCILREEKREQKKYRGSIMYWLSRLKMR